MQHLTVLSTLFLCSIVTTHSMVLPRTPPLDRRGMPPTESGDAVLKAIDEVRRAFDQLYTISPEHTWDESYHQNLLSRMTEIVTPKPTIELNLPADNNRNVRDNARKSYSA